MRSEQPYQWLFTLRSAWAAQQTEAAPTTGKGRDLSVQDRRGSLLTKDLLVQAISFLHPSK